MLQRQKGRLLPLGVVRVGPARLGVSQRSCPRTKGLTDERIAIRPLP